MDNIEKRKELVLGVLEKGLSFIADYIVDNNNCCFSISNSGGTILFEKNANDAISPENSLSRLSYTVETHEGNVILTMTGLPSDMLEQGMNSLKQVEFAVQCYFSDGNRKKTLDNVMKGGVVKYTMNQRLSREDFLDIVNAHCEPNSQYYVSILNDCTREEQRYMAKNLKRTNTFNISIQDDKNLVLIMQHTFNPLTNTIDVNSPSAQEQQKTFGELLQVYKGCPKFAIGNSYRPEALYLSYQQAMFTMSFMKLTGHKAFTQRYSELGMCIPLTSNNWIEVKDYCLKSLGALLDCDKLNNTCYYETLITYLDNNCNGKEAADQLYIHVNTLYYRLKKIEGLLGCTMTEMHDTAHLYCVAKIYEALLSSGIMDEERRAERT